MISLCNTAIGQKRAECDGLSFSTQFRNLCTPRSAGLHQFLFPAFSSPPPPPIPLSLAETEGGVDSQTHTKPLPNILFVKLGAEDGGGRTAEEGFPLPESKDRRNFFDGTLEKEDISTLQKEIQSLQDSPPPPPFSNLQYGGGGTALQISFRDGGAAL